MSDNQVVCSNCHRIYDSSRLEECPECSSREHMDITLMNNEPFKPEGYKAGIEELIPQVLEEEPIKWFQCKKPEEPTGTWDKEKIKKAYESVSDIVGPVPPGEMEVRRPLDQKHDEGRPAVGQMTADFPRALLMLAKLTSYGIKEGKAAGEWKNILNAQVRFEDALGRHNLEMHIHSRDQESMLPHAAHRAWDAMAVLELILMEQEGDSFEDM